MKLRQSNHLLICTIATGMCLCMASCGESEIPPPSRNELYNREFVKSFGVPAKGQSWSEARTATITVTADRTVPVTVMAEIDGERYLFASLGSVCGKQVIPVNIPRGVEQLIVSTGEREFTAEIGSTVNLTSPIPASRAAEGEELVWNMTYDGSEDARREIVFTGSMIRRSVLENYQIFDEPWRFDVNRCYYSMAFNTSGGTFFNIYPFFWRENKYGETDYLIGVYRKKTVKGNSGTAVITTSEIVQHFDLEEIPAKGNVKFKKAGTDEWVESVGSQAFPFTSDLSQMDSIKLSGIRVNLEDYKYGSANCFGFYIKSGLKDTYTEGFGRDCEHISYTELRYNAPYWGDNVWDLPLSRIRFSYAGARNYSYNMYAYSNNMPKRVKNSDGTLYRGDLVGFETMPDGVVRPVPEFADCMVLFEAKGGGAGKTPQNKGEAVKCFPWYLAAEDLGGSYDWDFNDLVVAVFDITTDITTKYSQKNGDYPVPKRMVRRIIVEPMAAGGTMPIYLMYEGRVAKGISPDTYFSELPSMFDEGTYILGTELHRWLRADTHGKPLNVGGQITHSGRRISFSVPLDIEEINPDRLPADPGKSNSTMHGFWVMVDSKDANRYYESLAFNPLAEGEAEELESAFTPFAGHLGESTYRIDAPTADKGAVAPQMLLCFRGWKWPREEVDVSLAYPWFKDWVTGSRPHWHPGSNTTDNPPIQATLVCENTPPAHQE